LWAIKNGISGDGIVDARYLRNGKCGKTSCQRTTFALLRGKVLDICEIDDRSESRVFRVDRMWPT